MMMIHTWAVGIKEVLEKDSTSPSLFTLQSTRRYCPRIVVFFPPSHKHSYIYTSQSPLPRETGTLKAHLYNKLHFTSFSLLLLLLLLLFGYHRFIRFLHIRFFINVILNTLCICVFHSSVCCFKVFTL